MLNNTTYSPSTGGVVALPSLTTKVKVDGSEYSVNSSGLVTLPNLAKSVYDGTNTYTTDATGKINISTLVSGLNTKIANNTTLINNTKSAVTKTLTIQRGGTQVGTYNGTADKTINITLPSFSEVLSKPTTLSGYGITDAYTKTATDSIIKNTLTSAKTYTDGYATPLTCLKSWYAHNGNTDNIVGWKICTLTLNGVSSRAVLMISGKTTWNGS